MSVGFHLSPAAYAQEAQDIAAGILTKRVEELFEKRWGSAWPQLLLDKMRREDDDKKKKSPDFRGRILFKIVNGKAAWDFVQMLYALMDNIDGFPSLAKQRGPIRGLCFQLRDGRVKLAHKSADFDRNDIDFAKGHIERLISLARFLVDEQDMEPVKRLLNDLIDKSRPKAASELKEPFQPGADGQIRNRDELAEIRAMLQGFAKVLDEKLTAQPPSSTEAKPTPPPVAASPPREVHRTRRRTPIPPPRTGLVAFPIVAEGPDADQHSELGYLSCTRYEPESRQDFLSRVIGFEGNGRSDTYYRIVMDARLEEHDPAKANLYTHARIDPGGFGGESFGLAAALADRSARYGWSEDVQDRRIVATGVIKRSGGGEIGPIDSFLEKLKLLEREASEQTIFVFPAANLQTASDPEKELLKHLQNSRGIRIYAAGNISDLEELFRTERALSPTTAAPTLTGPTADFAPDTSGITGLTKTRAPVALLVKAALGATALLSTLYLAATFIERDRLPAEQAQKIADLVQTQAGGRASAMSAQQCSALTRAERALAGIEPRRLDQQAISAMAEASACTRRIAESDARLSNLADVGGQLASTGPMLASCTSLATAADSLDAFDKERLSDAHRQALSIRNTCKPLLFESEKKLADLGRLASAVTSESGDLSACHALVAAGAQLSGPDIQRLQAKPGGAYEKLTSCSTRIQSSDNRIRTLINAADAFVPSNVGSIESLAAARANLQPADIGRLDPSQKDKILNAAARALELLRSSDARIGAFLASYAEWRRTSTPSARTAFDRAGQLSDFDRARITSPEARNAQAEHAKIRKEALASMDRWSLVERLTASAARQSPADYWKSLNDAVGRLTQQDKDGATVEQNATLEKASALLAAGGRRSVPGDEFGTMPAPRPPPNRLEGFQRPPSASDDFATVPSTSNNSRR